MEKINTIATIARPRTLIEWGPLSPSAANAYAGAHGASGAFTGRSAGTGTGASAAARLVVPATAGMRGTDLRVAGSTQEPPPRGNPR